MTDIQTLILALVAIATILMLDWINYRLAERETTKLRMARVIERAKR